MSEDIERQLDELSAMESMYEVHLQIDELELERLRSAASVAVDDVTELPELQFTVSVPLPESDPTTAGACQLRVAMPHEYPSEAQIRASCSAPGASRKLDEQLNSDLSQHLAASGVGAEAVMSCAMWLSEAAASLLAEAAASAEAAKEAEAEEEQVWSRCCFWAEKLLEGRTHKPAAKTLELASSAGFTGLFFYGRPGIIVAEGTQRDLDEFVREARRMAGKTPRPKKTQRLVEGAASRRYETFATVSAGASDSLDTERLQAELETLGISHKYKFIIGIEDIAG